MEMAQRQNQLKIAPKWIEFFSPFKKQKWIGFQDMVEKGEEDRISELPDFLLLDILSLLPSTKDAIRTGALSKRWKHIWTLLPNLVFKSYRLRPAFFSFVNKTLTQCRQLKLKKFEVNTGYSSLFRFEVNNWIRYAISRNVEKFNLTLWRFAEHDFLLDQSFFINTCFTDLTLRGCIFIPIGAINWPKLRTLSISIMNLNGALIKNILSGSPQLETLELNDCYGYRRLDITSKSVKNLVLDGCYCNSVEIKAPNILSLTIKGDLKKLLFVNMSSLVEANLDCQTWGHMHARHKEVEEEILKGYIPNLHHANELKIGINRSEVLSCLEAKGFVIPSNIKFLDASY